LVAQREPAGEKSPVSGFEDLSPRILPDLLAAACEEEELKLEKPKRTRASEAIKARWARTEADQEVRGGVAL
jgi:hypothetical protein